MHDLRALAICPLVRDLKLLCSSNLALYIGLRQRRPLQVSLQLLINPHWL